MYFDPLKIQRFNLSEKTSPDTPFVRQGRDIIHHVIIVLDKSLSGTALKGATAMEVNDLLRTFNRLSFESLRNAASIKVNCYEQLAKELPPSLDSLRVLIYGGSFRRALPKPLYSRSVFDDFVLLIRRELEELRQAEAQVATQAYRLHEFFCKFMSICEYYHSPGLLYAGHGIRTDHPQREYIVQAGELRDTLFFERSYTLMDELLKLIIESPFMEADPEAQDLLHAASLLREELEVEGLWERLARS